MNNANVSTHDAGGHKGQNLVFRSTDGGETWSDAQPTFDHVDEPHVTRLQSGEVLGAFRLQRSVLENDAVELVEEWGSRQGQGVSAVLSLGGTLFSNPGCPKQFAGFREYLHRLVVDSTHSRYRWAPSASRHFM